MARGEFPNSQLEGNRRLGQIPLRTYLDYDLDGVGFATEDDEFHAPVPHPLAGRLLRLSGRLRAQGPQIDDQRFLPAAIPFLLSGSSHQADHLRPLVPAKLHHV